ncbi:uncharacterized protein AKAW2_40022S [Aspergillus luchuensis]|uniref:Beta-mannosidase n=1 Tax=Aspergillus kawachii TaxID=1069201 RepID=A0A146F339_ASPKA|nr:uncharacterized protein AKAW2_40022S [Aspergillus luchuensis]BCR98339.1 hypothetical protein AKAW2_40022S [Aspergillus luchuensis]GAT20560.1 beta-mannosidase [Aspergillus luchuensis]
MATAIYAAGDPPPKTRLVDKQALRSVGHHPLAAFRAKSSEYRSFMSPHTDSPSEP